MWGRAGVGGSCGAVLMTIAVLLAPACARAQPDHGSGVAFVSATPLAFYKDKKTGRPPAGTPVEVFDGSSARETIRLVPTSAIGSALKVEPASQAVDPGAIASFTVRAVN